MTEHDDTNPFVVKVTLRDIYESVKTTESNVAQLTNDARHSQDRLLEADRDIRELMTKASNYVTRRELYSVAGLVAAIVSAASPFLAQLYGGS